MVSFVIQTSIICYNIPQHSTVSRVATIFYNCSLFFKLFSITLIGIFLETFCKDFDIEIITFNLGYDMLQFPLLSELRNVHSNLIKIFKLLSHLAIINEQMHFANKSKKDFILHFIYLLIELLFTQFRSYERYWRNS